MPAQGNPHPKSNFINHEVAERDGIVYDGSCGKTHASHLAWEDPSVAVYYHNGNAQNPTNDVKGVLETLWSELGQ